MRIVKLKGGLGNQMFQYAFAKNIENLTGEKVLLDKSAYEGREYDDIRKIRIADMEVSLQFASTSELDEVCIFRHGGGQTTSYKIGVLAESILNREYCFERTRKYIAPESILQYKYYDGYWQAWKNVYSVEKILRKEFQFKQNISAAADEIGWRMEKENSIFVGIRRGDYLSGKKERKHYGEYKEDYYLKGMDYIEKRVKNPVFYVFSNDKEWVRLNMRFEGHTVRYVDNKLEDIEEFILMGRCKHAIMNNSTFYWWGAWMIKNPDKIVIAPRNWFADRKEIEIVPDEWVRI